MYNKIKTALINAGFNGNGDSYSGVFNDYEVSVVLDSYEITAHLSAYMTKEQLSNIKSSMHLLDNGYSEYSWDAHGVTLSITDGNENVKLQVLNNWLNGTATIMRNNGALGIGYCPVCGVPIYDENSKVCVINGHKITLDKDCATKVIIKEEEEQRAIESAPNNYGKGFAGALVGGVCGIILATILYVIGFISAISSGVAFIVGMVLYKKFGGKPNWMMIFIVSLTTLVCMTLTIFVINVVYAYIMVLGEGYVMSAMEAFAVFMQNEQYARAFWVDIGMTALFTVVGSLFVMIVYVRRKKVKK